MKKQVVILLALFLLQPFLKAQTMNVSTFACASTFSAALSGSVTSANSYSWSTLPASNLSYMGGIYANFTPTASGLYTITCQPYSGTTPLTPITGTIQHNGTPLLSVNGFSNFATFNLCSGNSLTLAAQGANTYTWTGNVQSPTLVINPAGTTLYTLSGSIGSCVQTMDVVVNVTPGAPVLSFGNSPTVLCNGLANLIVSGASSYAWSNGPTTAANPVNSLGCYTVTGTNSCGTSTAAICVSGSGTTPTVSLSGLSNSLCANTSVTITASGAPNMTISGYPNNNFVTAASSTLAFTPTLTGSTCFTVTGNNNGCISSNLFCGNVPANTFISISGPTVYCSTAATATLAASGALSYTWSNGFIGPVLSFTPTASICYTVTGTNACGGLVSGVRCITVNQSPTLSISGNTAICSGNTNVFSALGATTYTWLNSNFNYLGSGSAIALGSNAGCFFAVSNVSGCSASSNTLCTTTLTSPTVSIAATSTAVCAGTTVTLTASGSNLFAWSNGVAGSSIIVTPSTSICYSVLATNTAGCSQIATRCIIVMPIPSNGNPTSIQVCSGTSTVLFATGATNYSWSTGATSASIAILPSSSSCYTVSSFNSNGCSSSTVHCVSVLPVMNLSIGGSNTVCLGSSLNLSATGGLVYNWSTGQMSNTISLLPTASTIISVSSTASNGCVSSASTAITVNSNCSDVWPGDANSDGLVSSSDLLEIGAAFNSTGAARSPGGNNWSSQYANNWTGIISSGKNKVHADCNGDGTVNANDTLAIFNNLSLTHAFRPGAPAAAADVQFTAENPVAYVGVWNRVDVLLGTSSTPAYTILGLSFDLRFDNSLLDAGQIYMEYDAASAINSGNQALRFRKTDLSNGVIYSANVRTDLTNVSAGGKLASIYFKVDALAGESDVINLKAENVKVITANSTRSDLQGDIINLPVSRSVGLNEQAQLPVFTVSPNPARHTIRINSTGKAYKIIDLSGRTVLMGSLTQMSNIDISSLVHGVYFVEVQNETGSALKKLIIAD